MEMSGESHNIVIVGAGICGLATALALHREGIRSVVIEKSETLRTAGLGIIIHSNGWRALAELGIASALRQTALSTTAAYSLSIPDGKPKRLPVGGLETRCLRRADVIKTLADELPPHTIRFGTKLVSLELDQRTSHPRLHFDDGTLLVAKVVIGCDGVNSVIAETVGLTPPAKLLLAAIRGYTYYENGHDFGSDTLFMNAKFFRLGRIPVNNNLIYWFFTRAWNSLDSMVSRDPVLVKESTVELLNGFPQHAVEMVKNGDLESLHLTQVIYRYPSDLITKSFRRGTVTLAGDALHAVGPFLAQGGCAAMEDGIVLARCLAQKMIICNKQPDIHRDDEKKMIEDALDDYAKQRRMSLFWLCLQSHLTAFTIHAPSKLVKFFCIFFLFILFRRPGNAYMVYDCRCKYSFSLRKLAKRERTQKY